MVIFFVLVAGTVGGLIRFASSAKLNGDLPLGTLAVNTMAASLLGYLTGSESPQLAIYGVGFLGALSTWSTLASEVADLARQERGWAAALYLAGTITSGVVAAWFGLRLGAL